MDKSLKEQVNALHSHAFTIDAHFDLTYDLAYRRERGERRVIENHYLPHFRAGKFDAVVSAIFIHDLFLPENTNGDDDDGMEQEARRSTDHQQKTTKQNRFPRRLKQFVLRSNPRPYDFSPQIISSIYLFVSACLWRLHSTMSIVLQQSLREAMRPYVEQGQALLAFGLALLIFVALAGGWFSTTISTTVSPRSTKRRPTT